MDLYLPSGAHVCHLFSGPVEQKQVLLPFCSEGLTGNEFCSLAAAANIVDDWAVELQVYGIDVQADQERGALLINAIGVPTENFRPVRQARDLWRMMQPKLERFSAVRMLREQPWSDDLAMTVEDLCHYELTMNLLFENTDARSVCQYDLKHHQPWSIHTALRTHPLVILAGKLRTNPFFDGPAILKGEPDAFSSDAGTDDVARMLASLR
jgi:hypothetical protein